MISISKKTSVARIILSEFHTINKLDKYPWLNKEKDACGVGLIAHLDNKPEHKLMMNALEALATMEHRGACSADEESGDGAGILFSIPWKFFAEWSLRYKQFKINTSQAAVAMLFLPRLPNDTQVSKTIVEEIFQDEDFIVIGWREVPYVKEVLGPLALRNMPQIYQVVVQSKRYQGQALDFHLYRTRRKIEKEITVRAYAWTQDFYFCSFSNHTIVYKGMVKSMSLGQFYQDLYNPDFEISFAVFHRRFSTNTMPRWPLAQPMRILGHNGEINTLLGNLKWMEAREASLNHPTLNEVASMGPVVNLSNSDSANLDSVVELFLHFGHSCPEALMFLIPEAYENNPKLKYYENLIDFYEYCSGFQEAWDGPALIVFTDGYTVGASLDRNGLRPARYCVTQDNVLILASEGGVLNINPSLIKLKGRLGPGEMIVLDLQEKLLMRNLEIKNKIASLRPYGEWIKQNRQIIIPSSFLTCNTFSSQEVFKRQTCFGYTSEDIELVIENMAIQGKEPTFCMGDDTPLAVLSGKSHVLYDYFKQRFAQVTNPPIDSLRESLVMSISSYLGSKTNLFEEHSEKILKTKTPVLSENDLTLIKNSGLLTATLITTFEAHFNSSQTNGQSLFSTINQLCKKAKKLIQSDVKIIILSDKVCFESTKESYIPPLLVVGALHQYLIKQGLRQRASLIVETGQCWSTHHFACLLGYGASAVCPYLALETVRHWWMSDRTQNLMSKGKMANLTLIEVQNNYCKSVERGLLKILSKMGISLLTSYIGAQIFEILGLNKEVVDLAFEGTVSRIGGLNFGDLAMETIDLFTSGFSKLNKKKLDNHGFVQYRPGGEYHLNNPEMSKALHKAVRENSYTLYEAYKQLLVNRPPTTIRDLLEFNFNSCSVPLEKVENISKITKRFCTGGMSLGALSREAHETLSIAMNRIGGKSNSGEGGEDPLRFIVLANVDETGNSPSFPHLKGLRNGDSLSSAIKQIASGRFGVTPEYLVNAKQLEIKIAQGAKPGEGGQLPGKKVSPYIATLRACKPGVTLISPPPHHDIYSIEDLAQLIFDLHQVNPECKVSVKLVSEIGVGTIAVGVAKAGAEIIQISGHDGGTGASPLSSIKHAGVPWELGLHEVHCLLVENNLRDKVILRVDGGLRTGQDVVMAALLGADEYGFGTIAMIAGGCIMARVCHTNSCPVGVATQKEELRMRYPGVSENVVNYFMFLAEEIRVILSRLGVEALSQIIGRKDLINRKLDRKLCKTSCIDTSIFFNVKSDEFDFVQRPDFRPKKLRNSLIDCELLSSSEILYAINHHKTIEKHIKISNSDRSVGAKLAGQLAKQYNNEGFFGSLILNFYGTAGQSFGAFNIKGVTLRLIGEANDYVGKSMSGGEIIIVPPSKVAFDSSEQVILGNTCLYGATGGFLFAYGAAGERFAVRNSNAFSVLEGVGDHACEYMTGGKVVVLGKAGRNIAAGMTGGIAYFLDEYSNLPEKVNLDIVKIQRVVTNEARKQLTQLIEKHVLKTGSKKAMLILQKWEIFIHYFWQIVPPSESETSETNYLVENKALVN